MEISGITAAGTGPALTTAPGTATGCCGTAATADSRAPAGRLLLSTGAASFAVDSLLQALQGSGRAFGAADFALVLLLLAALAKDDEGQSGGSAALGLLAGLALAGQLSRTVGLELTAPVQNVTLEGGLGGSIHLVV